VDGGDLGRCVVSGSSRCRVFLSLFEIIVFAQGSSVAFGKSAEGAAGIGVRRAIY
jgi:hypothetical protein